MGGEEKVLTGEIIGPALKDLSTAGWHEPAAPVVTAYLETPYHPVTDANQYPDLWQGRHGPRDEALKRGGSPISLNFYMHEKLDNRVNAYFQRKEERERKGKATGRSTPTRKVKTRRDVRQDFLSVKPITPHELCVCVGLLIARTIMPNREKLANHWRQDDLGAISHGIFGRFMGRQCMVVSFSCERIAADVCSCIHSSGTAIIRRSDASVTVALQSHTNVYESFEVYCGQNQYIAESGAVDMKSGPAAVVRNLRAVFGDKPHDKDMSLVVVDRFYTRQRQRRRPATATATTVTATATTSYRHTADHIITASTQSTACTTALRNQAPMVGAPEFAGAAAEQAPSLRNLLCSAQNVIRCGFCKAVVAKKKKRPKDVPRDDVVVVDEDAEEREADTGSHVAKQSGDWRDHSGQRKRVQKNCKVCTLKTSSGKRGATSTYFCDGCDFPGPIYLCVKPKWTIGNKMMSCWDVWHKEYNNGKSSTEELKGKIRVRAQKSMGSPGKSPAKRRRVNSEERSQRRQRVGACWPAQGLSSRGSAQPGQRVSRLSTTPANQGPLFRRSAELADSVHKLLDQVEDKSKSPMDSVGGTMLHVIYCFSCLSNSRTGDLRAQ
ncbi:hypothetical protein ON010_g5670 [Phytophthora cinnamomi]|nr:hypothetical protein ON010_g5670 [Phytophthora cinnamomi]